MCPFFRAVFASVVLALSITSLAWAHAPFETSLRIQRSEENLEVSAVYALETARLLLPVEKRDGFNAATFPSHRDLLRAAAASVCTLFDASANPLPPLRVLLTLDHEGEVRFLVLYPADAQPSRLGVPFLDTQPECFCELVDFTGPSPRRVALLKDRATYDFAPLPGS